MQNKKHRSPEQVAVDIITACRHKPQTLTRIVERANITNQKFHRIIPKMIEEGLLWKWRAGTYLSSVYGGQWVDRINRK